MRDGEKPNESWTKKELLERIQQLECEVVSVLYALHDASDALATTRATIDAALRETERS